MSKKRILLFSVIALSILLVMVILHKNDLTGDLVEVSGEVLSSIEQGRFSKKRIITVKTVNGNVVVCIDSSKAIYKGYKFNGTVKPVSPFFNNGCGYVELNI